MHPIDTITGLGKVAVGGSAALQKKLGLLDPNVNIEGEAAARQLAAPFVQAARKPSGIPQQLADYGYEKPLSAAMNLAAGVGAAGKVAGISRAPELAKALAKGSEVVNPMAQGVKVAQAVGPKLSSVGKEVLGSTTGAGRGAIEEAVKGTPAFKKAMRGEITGEEIVDNARSAVGAIKESRAAAYQEKLKSIADDVSTPNSAAANIDMTPIHSKLTELADRYNVKHTLDPKTGGTHIDLSRVPMNQAGRSDIAGVLKTLDDWGTKVGDRSALGLDILKRQLDDFYSDSSPARGFVGAIRDTVKKTIEQAVPEYGEMTKGYHEASKLVRDMEKTLSLKGGNSQRTSDQVLRRLTSSLKEGGEMRKDLLDVLGQKGGQDLAGQVAGNAMRPAMPKGLVGKLAGGGLASMTYFVNPQLWPALAAASPRIMGEFLNAYGKALHGVRSAADKIPVNIPNIGAPAATQGAFQAQQALQPQTNPQEEITMMTTGSVPKALQGGKKAKGKGKGKVPVIVIDIVKVP